MIPPSLPRRTFDKPEVGAKVSFTRTFTEADVSAFIGVTWDVNPYHSDEAYAKQTRFGKRIAPGLLPASMLTHIGGLWAYLATEMQFEFLLPVYIGDTITADIEVIEIDDRGRVQLECRLTNAEGAEVLKGRCRASPARSKPSCQ